jgi:predicted metal-dependent enzyme (double-stranded beta helix superfamily)
MNRALLLAASFLALAASPIQNASKGQHYPNVEGEVLLENDRVIVQKFVIAPGQWEGVHPHPGNQLYVHIRGGEWTVRFGDKKTTSTSPDGSVGWMDAVSLSQDHESGNTGATPIEFLWVTLK